MCLICNGASVLIRDQYQADAEVNIVKGSSDFLDAFSKATLMWRDVELAELDEKKLDSAKLLCSSAIKALHSSKEKYQDILKLLKEKGPKPEAVEALKKFDYEKLTKNTDFSGEEWDEFVSTAKAGNVYGLLNDFVRGVDRIIELLEEEHIYLKAYKTPPAKNFGRVMRIWQSLIEHGHQSALVFRNLGFQPINLIAHK